MMYFAAAVTGGNRGCSYRSTSHNRENPKQPRQRQSVRDVLKALAKGLPRGPVRIELDLLRRPRKAAPRRPWTSR